MKVSVIGSTCNTQKDALLFAGHAAGVCYMPDTFETLMEESEEKTLKRAKTTLSSGHHSVYDHITYNLLIEDIPKILAIVLNNEGFYTTSEKSARYTKMKPDDVCSQYYEKWFVKFSALIEVNYGDKFLEFYQHQRKCEKAIEKLAMENARYMTSVFTPTTMIYTVSLRQLNYLLAFFEKYISNAFGDFEIRLANCMKEFCLQVPNDLKIPELNANLKGREISLFRKDDTREEYFGRVYSTSYLGSWAMYAQAQRHRTLTYQLSMNYQIFFDDSCFITEKQAFYLPVILSDNYELCSEWSKDLEEIDSYFPQAQLILIHESGTYDDFLLKCYERICGMAQLEIMEQTRNTAIKYRQVRPDLIPEIFTTSARGAFPCFKCSDRCVWGCGRALTREI